MRNEVTIISNPPVTVPRRNHIFPLTTIAVGLGLTAAWIFLLAYGLVSLAGYVI